MGTTIAVNVTLKVDAEGSTADAILHNANLVALAAFDAASDGVTIEGVTPLVDRKALEAEFPNFDREAFEQSLNPRQRGGLDLYRACQLAQYESLDGSRQRHIGYEPEADIPFVVIEFKKPEGREARWTPKGSLVRSDSKRFTTPAAAEAYAERA